MSCRSTSWLICVFMAVALAADNSASESTKGSDAEVTVNHLRTDNPESSTIPAIGEPRETEAADLTNLLDAGRGLVTQVEGETRLVAQDAPEASSDQVSVADVGGQALRHLMACTYTLRVSHLSRTDPQLLAAADKFGLPAPKSACEKQVASLLTVDNAAAAAVVAVRHAPDSLRQAVIDFVKAHLLRVVATRGWAEAMQSQPEELLQVIQLLSRRSEETSVPATGDSRAAAASSSSGHGCTPVAVEPPAAACRTPPPGDAVVSRMRELSGREKGRRLLEAAKQSRISEMRVLLAAGVDVGATGSDGSTALHWAAKNGQVEMAKCLLAAGANVDAKDESNWTALFWAAKQGQLEVAKTLLSAGADLEARDKWQNTPLFLAAMTGHTDVLRLLVASCADPNAREQYETTPLHWAARNGQAGAVAALLELGAEKKARNRPGRLPLDEAREWSDQQLINMLS